jgi:hypothetical protein
LIISLNSDFKDIKLDRTKVSHYKNFFKLEKNFDFNTLAFFLDRKENDNQYFLNGKIKLQNFDIFDEGRYFSNFVKDLLLDKNFNKIDTDLFASLSKIALSENHSDIESVFLFPLIGSVIYNVYDETNFTSYYMSVGDLLIIPKHIIHAAIPLCPRIVVSVGVFD